MLRSEVGALRGPPACSPGGRVPRGGVPPGRVQRPPPCGGRPDAERRSDRPTFKTFPRLAPACLSHPTCPKPSRTKLAEISLSRLACLDSVSLYNLFPPTGIPFCPFLSLTSSDIFYPQPKRTPVKLSLRLPAVSPGPGGGFLGFGQLPVECSVHWAGPKGRWGKTFPEG